MQNLEEFSEKAKLVRKWCLISTTEAESGHATSCLSAADIATVLFDKYFSYDLKNPLNEGNDRFVLSKGHAAPLLYTLFAMAGAFPLEKLKTLRKFNSNLEGHPTPEFIYAEAATGSLGQGLSVGAGLAFVAKRENLPYKTYVLCGDGELAEGQIWEAANFSSHYELDNLIAILDINRLGQSQETMFGHDVEKYIMRFESFGFEVISIDGHDLNEIDQAFDRATKDKNGKPYAIIAKTLKGKGISLVEDKDGWHGKALSKEQLEKALPELGQVNDDLRFHLKEPQKAGIATDQKLNANSYPAKYEKGKEIATREVFGKVISGLAKQNKNIYALDGDVKNSTFSEDFFKTNPEHSIECYIAEQNMVSVAVGLSRLKKIPFVATFAAFLARAADQIRMARVSDANIKFIGSHVGVSIGEDGPSQMGLEDIAMFGAIPDSMIFQPCDAVSATKLISQMAAHQGISYMRTLRPKTPVVYDNDEEFYPGGSKLLRQSTTDELTIVASGITVFEALNAADELKKEGINVRVVDCYSIKPVDKIMLDKCLGETKKKILITVEDHYEHGGLGDFVISAVDGTEAKISKMAVTKISRSGTKDELLNDAGINFSHIIAKVKEQLMKKVETTKAAMKEY
jgi:transketolase